MFDDNRVDRGESAGAAALVQQHKAAGAAKTISDLYLADAETGIMEAAHCQTLEELRERLANSLAHNGSETRLRSARFAIRWFFPDGSAGIASKTWAAYQDRRILADVLRYLYMSQEPVMGRASSSACSRSGWACSYRKCENARPTSRPR